jgi:sacsin
MKGESLLAFNDGIFREEDWDNIQHLGRSYKKSDPLKVGRFGLGFIAVYHITGIQLNYKRDLT